MLKLVIKDPWTTAEAPLLTSVLVNKSLLMLNTSKLPIPAKKLLEKFLGPFDIIARPGTHSWTLQLPDHLHAIHPVSHVSQLEPSVPNTILNCTQPPPPPVVINDELEYEIAEILDSKIDNLC